MKRLTTLLCLLLAPAAARAADAPALLLADFESPDYAGWTATGEAFGTRPAAGTLARQQPVTGFAGKGLVNSYLHGDASRGTLTSPPFQIERDYITFLIGGGNHPNSTCIDLLVDGRAVRTASGVDDETLSPFTWNVRDLKGRSVQLRITDAETGGWGHINIDHIMQTDHPQEPPFQSQPLYHERYRPQFHFSPARGWMNDPNGLVYYDGEYHLFFQHRPDALAQTPVMSWGHAVSPDLLHWTELPIALKPDDKDGNIWSGSAVVDWQNTSNFGTGNNPPLVAMYTAAKDPFAQSLAYSNDRGRTWIKYPGNPVLPHVASANRDPRLVWHAPTKRWVMALYKDVGDTFCLFASTDLKTWKHLQDLQIPGCTECPDFFPLAIDGDADRLKWVFTAANGKYLVGAFDGQTFIPEQDVRQTDYGQNFYAVQTWCDTPDNRRIQIAWMRDGKYPRMPFNQQMSFPRELTLRRTPDGLRLFARPIRELAALRTNRQTASDLPLAHDTTVPQPTTDAFELTAEFDAGNAEEFGLVVRGVSITYSTQSRRLTALGSAPLDLDNGHLKLHLLVDRTSLELFANDGRISLTSCFLPAAADPTRPAIIPFSRGGTARLLSFEAHSLKPTWPVTPAPRP